MEKFIGKMKKGFRGEKGFTLIELIVVIAVLTILVLLAVPKFIGHTKEAKVTAMQSDVRILSNAALLYNIDNNGAWPGTTDAKASVTGGLEAYMTGLGYDAAEDEVVAFNAANLENYVKSLRSEASDYVLVTSGELEGEVFHVAGEENKENVKQYGVVMITEAIEISPELQTEVDKLTKATLEAKMPEIADTNNNVEFVTEAVETAAKSLVGSEFTVTATEGTLQTEPNAITITLTVEVNSTGETTSISNLVIEYTVTM